MDGLSGAASIISVASIAIQLADGVRKLYIFWSDVQDAPAHIRTISEDSNFLLKILAEIASEGQHIMPDDLLTTSLNQCQSKVIKLTLLVHNLNPARLESKKFVVRKWTAIRTVLKADKLKEYQEILASLESKLMLVLQTQQR